VSTIAFRIVVFWALLDVHDENPSILMASKILACVKGYCQDAMLVGTVRTRHPSFKRSTSDSAGWPRLSWPNPQRSAGHFAIG